MGLGVEISHRIMNTRTIRALALSVLLVGCSSNTGKFVLVNDTDEMIEQIYIEISGVVFDIKNIDPGEMRSGKYKVKGDSHYQMEVVFVGGRVLSHDLGYVTRGFDFQHTFRVSENEITLSDTEVK